MVGAWKLKEGMALNVATYMEAVWYLRGSGDFWVEGTAVNMAVGLAHRDLWYMSLLRGSSFVSPQLVKRINTVF